MFIGCSKFDWEGEKNWSTTETRADELCNINRVWWCCEFNLSSFDSSAVFASSNMHDSVADPATHRRWLHSKQWRTCVAPCFLVISRKTASWRLVLKNPICKNINGHLQHLSQLQTNTCSLMWISSFSIFTEVCGVPSADTQTKVILKAAASHRCYTRIRPHQFQVGLAASLFSIVNNILNLCLYSLDTWDKTTLFLTSCFRL